jgi:hypothetical protein
VIEKVPSPFAVGGGVAHATGISISPPLAPMLILLAVLVAHYSNR